MTDALPDSISDVPEALWKAPWDDIISEHEGETEKLLRVACNMGRMLEPCQNWQFRPGAVAWFLLWSRNFHVVQSALAALDTDLTIVQGGQLHTLEILYRQALELQLDLMAIADPRKISLGDIERENWAEVYDHHCAYLAFCANNETRYLGEMTKDYVREGTKELPPQYKDKNYQHWIRELWGEGDTEDNPQDRGKKISRAEQLKFYKSERNRLRQWLEHEELIVWDNRFRKSSPDNFVGLLLGEKVSTRERLKKYGMGFGYPTYQSASSIIHGSFVSPFIGYSGWGLSLSLLGSEEDLQRQASHVRRFTHNNAFRLLNLRACIDHICGVSG